MLNRRNKPGQIVNLLRKIEVEIATARRQWKRREKWESRSRRIAGGGRNTRVEAGFNLGGSHKKRKQRFDGRLKRGCEGRRVVGIVGAHCNRLVYTQSQASSRRGTSLRHSSNGLAGEAAGESISKEAIAIARNYETNPGQIIY